MISDEDEEETAGNISIQDQSENLLSEDDENKDESYQFNSVLTRMDLIEEMRRSGHSFIDTKKQQDVLFEYVKSKLSVSEKNLKVLEEKVRVILNQIIKKYIKSSRKYQRFVKNNKNFLSKTFDLTDIQQPGFTSRKNNGMFCYIFKSCQLECLLRNVLKHCRSY